VYAERRSKPWNQAMQNTCSPSLESLCLAPSSKRLSQRGVALHKLIDRRRNGNHYYCLYDATSTAEVTYRWMRRGRMILNESGGCGANISWPTLMHYILNQGRVFPTGIRIEDFPNTDQISYSCANTLGLLNWVLVSNIIRLYRWDTWTIFWTDRRTCRHI